LHNRQQRKTLSNLDPQPHRALRWTTYTACQFDCDEAGRSVECSEASRWHAVEAIFLIALVYAQAILNLRFEI